jgi:hypothetical protein
LLSFGSTKVVEPLHRRIIPHKWLLRQPTLYALTPDIQNLSLTNVQVTVGGPGGLVYSPEQLAPAVGDLVVFEFWAANHTVTQSPFDTPCKKLEGGLDSGFMANPNNTVVPPPQMAMQVTTDKPLCEFSVESNT